VSGCAAGCPALPHALAAVAAQLAGGAVLAPGPALPSHDHDSHDHDSHDHDSQPGPGAGTEGVPLAEVCADVPVLVAVPALLRASVGAAVAALEAAGVPRTRVTLLVVLAVKDALEETQRRWPGLKVVVAQVVDRATPAMEAIEERYMGDDPL
jgi:hypothetical protein